MADEYFEIVDEENRVIGKALRSECHGNPALIHRTAHVLVFNSAGQLYLQKRSQAKDVAPGKWDTSVGGHLDVGETPEQAALRECREELGITGPALEHLYDLKIRNSVESENVTTYRTVWDGLLTPDPAEIETGRFWDLGEIRGQLGSGVFTRSLETEVARYLETFTAR